jgi:hypothetical protein
MGQKLLVLSLVAVIVLFTAAQAVSADQRGTDNFLSTQPSLDGYRIYFSESNNEASRFDRSAAGLSRLAGLLQLQGAELYTLEWRYGIPADASLVIIAGPVSDLNAEQVARLWIYLNDGGRLLLLTEPGIDRVRAFAEEKGLFELTWHDFGIRALDNVLVTEGAMQMVALPPPNTENSDTATPAATDPTPAPEMVEAPILITDLVAATIDHSHPITSNLSGDLAFFGARAVEVDSSLQLAEVTPLVFSGGEFYGETAYNDYRDSGYSTFNADEDTARGPMTLAAAARNPANGMRLVIIGDRDFATNGGGLRSSPPNSSSFVYQGNVEFLLNAIAWLLEAEPDAVEFPTPAPTSTALPTMTPVPEGEASS